MAKSLKSKSKREFRKIKREDPSSVYKRTETARLERLSSKLKESAKKPRALTDVEEYERKQSGVEEGVEVDVEGDGMNVEEEGEKEGEEEGDDSKKVSTSGPRMSRREKYRTSKGFQIRLTPKTHFRAKGEGKRMGCKPHRRR
ncbi:hypothetical protein T439DRAFT_178058 [Meredithblackwellia eburnea MCA 4105]